MFTNRSQVTLLVVLGLVAAMATGAAITLWLSRGNPQPSLSATTASGPPPASSPRQDSETPTSAPMAAGNRTGSSQQETGVFINERQLTPQQVAELVQIYRFPPPRGHFWYDSRSGLYGIWGHETAGFIHAGHDFGPLPANASGGNTGVFINGRELNMIEAMYCQQLFGEVHPGRAWLDGRTGNIGLEGNPMPIANLWIALQQAQRSSGTKQWGWRDGSGATMSSDGNCTMMAVPGAPVYSSGGC